MNHKAELQHGIGFDIPWSFLIIIPLNNVRKKKKKKRNTGIENNVEKKKSKNLD